MSSNIQNYHRINDNIHRKKPQREWEVFRHIKKGTVAKNSSFYVHYYIYMK